MEIKMKEKYLMSDINKSVRIDVIDLTRDYADIAKHMAQICEALQAHITLKNRCICNKPLKKWAYLYNIANDYVFLGSDCARRLDIDHIDKWDRPSKAGHATNLCALCSNGSKFAGFSICVVCYMDSKCLICQGRYNKYTPNVKLCLSCEDAVDSRADLYTSLKFRSPDRSRGIKCKYCDQLVYYDRTEDKPNDWHTYCRDIRYTFGKYNGCKVIDIHKWNMTTGFANIGYAKWIVTQSDMKKKYPLLWKRLIYIVRMSIIGDRLVRQISQATIR